MSSPSIQITAFVYGYDEIRLEADLVVPIDPPALAENKQELHAFARTQIYEFLPDLKHSNPMTCEFCGKRARENYLNIASWLHLPAKGTPWMGKPSPGPSITLYIHAVCTMGSSCGKKAKELSSMTARMGGTPETHSETKSDGTVYPMNASCAFCMTDGSAKGQLLKCGNCKTTHYCGKVCQKKDWKRHKTPCKWIKGTRFVDSEGEVKVWKETTTA